MAHVFRFFAPADAVLAEGADVVLAPDDAERVRKVLRLGEGEGIEIVGAAGEAFAAVVVDPRLGTVRVGAALPPQPPLAPVEILLALSGAKADDAVARIAELGVAGVSPLLAARRRHDARPDRWRRIVRGAAEQAKLPAIPMVGEPVAFADALGPGAIICSHEEDDATLDAALARPARPLRLLIGPEAGFAPEELARARDAGAPIASLGPTVLRSETAAIAAAVLVVDRLRGSTLPA
jgi:16S rRNA (uracil1498-N3)-methyltransferase